MAGILGLILHTVILFVIPILTFLSQILTISILIIGEKMLLHFRLQYFTRILLAVFAICVIFQSHLWAQSIGRIEKVWGNAFIEREGVAPIRIKKGLDVLLNDVIDAKDKVLGRFASEIAKILRGKHKVEFTPHVDTGDYVVVVNADKIRTRPKLPQCGI